MRLRLCLARCAGIAQLETGAATAEFALVLPSVVAVAGIVLVLGRAVVTSMDCQSAATAAARALVVEDEEAARLAAAQIVGSNVDMNIGQGEQTVHVTVTCPVGVSGLMNLTPLHVTGEAVAIRQ
ncbi:TadE family type IV pilus minor pilin [Bifidobacterium oedipodis]|uniref:Pilus assembly protein TadE n=1 Tax=Bifidobacterium oedipodis TaxID=2675322 RepID=A0A7Y0HSS6_9BIFI|nr:TadE family type IV pilus minor pilin [Bifidobacterium sp. DSM 109957]NMM93332.1 pilus assembly protein TadE [Bifidobacterium sp. DSM 109957]